jgi:hypothetical protein
MLTPPSQLPGYIYGCEPVKVDLFGKEKIKQVGGMSNPMCSLFVWVTIIPPQFHNFTGIYMVVNL